MAAKQILFEACVDSLESSIAAQEGGADRLELCADLIEGGITPSAGTIDLVCRRINIPVMVMIRPRGGDFCYSNYEFEEMKRDIELAKQYNISGIVFGILNEDGTIDKERTKELIQLSRPLKITFHRAFDITRNPFEALKDLINLDVERVLTSGQEVSAYKGMKLIEELAMKGKDKIIIIPGGGINENNAAEIVKRSNVKEIHGSARAKKENGMMATSAERIRKIKEAING